MGPNERANEKARSERQDDRRFALAQACGWLSSGESDAYDVVDVAATFEVYLGGGVRKPENGVRT